MLRRQIYDGKTIDIEIDNDRQTDVGINRNRYYVYIVFVKCEIISLEAFINNVAVIYFPCFSFCIDHASCEKLLFKTN